MSAELGLTPARRRRAIRLDGGGFVLLAPAAVLLFVGFILPVAYAFYLGFTNLSLVGPTAQHYRITGLTNVFTLIHDSLFWNSLQLTAVFVAGSAVVGVTVVSMVLALLMQRAIPWVGVAVGGLVILAWILPPITGAIVWFAFSTQGGTLSALIGGDPLFSAPMLIVGIANVWSTAGFGMLIMSGGLRSISSEVIEAARLERASGWQTFWRIVVPLMQNTIIAAVLIVVLLSLGNFTLIFIMTGGGPGTETSILPIYSYIEAFTFNRLAYGALIGDVIVVLGSVLAYLYVRFASQQN